MRCLLPCLLLALTAGVPTAPAGVPARDGQHDQDNVATLAPALETAPPAQSVNACDEPNLRAAIDAGVNVAFACDGVIRLHQPLVIPGHRVLDAAGRRVVLDGGGSNRLVVVQTNVELRLLGLTLTRGYADRGGALLNQGGRVTLENCTLAGNDAVGAAEPAVEAAGGALHSQGGSLTVLGSLFISNRAIGGIRSQRPVSARGGAAYVDSPSCRFERCVFKTNVAEGGFADISFSAENGDASGGALALTNAEVAVVACEFKGNSATSPWGGNSAFGSQPGNSTGGAIAHLGRGELRLEDSAFDGNLAHGSNGGRNGAPGTAQGGAVWSVAPTETVRCRFTSNSVRGGGGSLARAGDGRGGALYLGHLSQVHGSVFVANAAEAGWGCSCGLQGIPKNGDALGGAIFALYSTVIGESSFRSNRVFGMDSRGGPVVPLPGASRGGALYSASDATLLNSTFLENRAVSQSSTTFPDTTRGPAEGAAIYAAGVSLTLRYSTIATNVSDGPATNTTGAIAIATRDPALLGAVVLSGSLPANLSGPITDLGSLLSSDSHPGITGPDSRAGVDPRLGAPRTATPFGVHLPLLPGSPAIDGSFYEGAAPFDQLGTPRPIGPRRDIGAVEFQPPPRLVPAPSGILQGRFIAGPSVGYVVESSADLLDWTPHAEITSDPDGVIAFEVQPDPSPSRRFFRVRPSTTVPTP